MAKKKASQGAFVMSAEMRKVVSENPEIKGKDAIALLKKRFPGEKINENSANVAFSNARKAIGVSGKTSAPAASSTPTRRPAPAKTQAPKAQTGNFNVLEAAKELVEAAGDSQTAIEALKQLDKLQVGK
ncbi:hypothetical protein KOR42_55570 [Thalassoglobus neptunius]|uniref:Uncharacterized protein n=1 Tax=Thalassoglobus neptunius TaxID=1938619 RepID=A0A5C5USL4_9PLAN|nr:hypothetical protein [Thalassoglobus neptunius]TWT29156.1 hypothetical protein KOR42_55570 [Thalassoglobus neptunius]